MGFSLDDLNPFSGNGIGKKIFDPGAKDRRRATEQQKEAIAEWEKLQGQVPDQAQLQYGTDVVPYEVGPELQTQQESYLNPMSAAYYYGIAPTSAAYTAESAYDDLGPSAWKKTGSTWENAGPSAWKNAASAYGDLGPSASEGLDDADYFRTLAQTGKDPIAEADYERRAAQAAQSRKANTDAALAAMEAKGQGNVGGALSARMEGAQDEANARYLYGLGAAGQAAGRRDTAASAVASIDQAQADAMDRYNQAKAAGLDEASARRASGIDAYTAARNAGLDDAAARKAAGLDSYNTTVAGGQDAFTGMQVGAEDAWANQRYEDLYGLQARNADRAQSTAEQNWQRANSVGDTNANNQTATAQFNKVEAPQQTFQNQTTAVAGKTGQLGSQSALYQQQSQRDPWWKAPAQIGANVAKAAG